MTLPDSSTAPIKEEESHDHPLPTRGLTAPSEPPPPPPVTGRRSLLQSLKQSSSSEQTDAAAQQVMLPESSTPPVTDQVSHDHPAPSPVEQRQTSEDRPEEEPNITSSKPEETDEQPIRMDGTLEIKLKHKQGLEKWDEVFAVLQGETLSLFTDREAAAQKASRWPPINTTGAVCRENVYNRKKENTFKLILEDGSQYLFAASSRELQLLWIKKLKNANESTSSDSDDSGRASSVNLSLEKLTEPLDDSPPSKPLDTRAQSLDRQSSTESQPPPKPPHTYYNRHRYPDGGEVGHAGSPPPSTPPPAPPPEVKDPTTASNQGADDSRERTKRSSVFRKFFTKSK